MHVGVSDIVCVMVVIGKVCRGGPAAEDFNAAVGDSLP